jgi:hypothetical protein
MVGNRWNAGGLSHNGISVLVYCLWVDARNSALAVSFKCIFFMVKWIF